MEQDECLFLLIFHLVSVFFGSYGFFTSIVNSCWALLEIQRMREIVVDQSPYGVEALSMWPFCVPTSGVVFVHYFNAFSILI